MTMRLLLGAMVSLVLLSTPAHAWQWPWASADERANKLFVEAVPLWNQYQALPEEDPVQYEARLQLLSEIDKNLKSILQDYPESSLAVELVSTGAIKPLNQEQIEAEIPRLQQSIPAAALLAEMLPLGQQYDAMPQDDPAQYEARLKLITQIDANLEKLLKDYPLSYEAGSLANGPAKGIKAEIAGLQQSIPASALMAEMSPLWQQYQALPTDDQAQYEARLTLLTQVDVNLDKLLKDYPQSYEVENLLIDTQAIKPEISRLRQSIPASALMAETSTLWQQYQALPTDDAAQYEARLKLLTQVDGNLDKLLNDYPLSYEVDAISASASQVELAAVEAAIAAAAAAAAAGSDLQNYEVSGLTLDVQAIKAEIPRLLQSIPASVLMAETSPLWEQYQALQTDDPTQYEARLELLAQVDANLDKLLKDYPQSYEVENVPIDAKGVKTEITRLMQSIRAALLIPINFDAAKVNAMIVASALDDATKAALTGLVDAAAINPASIGAALDVVKIALGM